MLKTISAFILALFLIIPTSCLALDSKIQVISQEKYDDNGNEGSWSKGFVVDFKVKGQTERFSYVLICEPDVYSHRAAILMNASTYYEVPIMDNGPFANSESTAYDFWNSYCKK